MGKKDSLKTAKELAELFNQENIVSFTNCMTRLRVTVKEGVKINQEKIKSIDNVVGLIVNGDEYQIILTPGFVNSVVENFKKIINLENEISNKIKVTDSSFAELPNLEKQKMNNLGAVNRFLVKFSKIFAPIIPALIAAGILSGVAGLVLSIGGGAESASSTVKTWNTVFSFSLAILSNVFVILVGWRMGDIFGGSSALCALVAATFCGFAGASVAGVFIPITDGSGNITAYNFLGMIINKTNIQHNWFTVGFVNVDQENNLSLGAPHAGLIGAMIAVGFAIYIEKQIRKVIPNVLDMVVVPFLVILAMLVLNFILIIPVGGYLFTGITWLLVNLYTNPFGAAFLVGIYIFIVICGVHQGLIPIYFALWKETGINGLFPIMCMSNAAGIGCTIAIWIMAEKGSMLKKQIPGTLLSAFLGIGEPLLFGVFIPRVKPLFVSAIAGAIGGFLMAALNIWGNIGIGANSAYGPDGILSAILMTTTDGNAVKGILAYLAILLTVYVIGAAVTFFAYSRVARFGSEKTANITNSWLAIIKNKNEKLENKIISSLKQFALMLTYVTIIGLPIIWLTWYYKSSSEEKAILKQYKLV